MQDVVGEASTAVSSAWQLGDAPVLALLRCCRPMRQLSLSFIGCDGHRLQHQQHFKLKVTHDPLCSGCSQEDGQHSAQDRHLGSSEEQGVVASWQPLLPCSCAASASPSCQCLIGTSQQPQLSFPLAAICSTHCQPGLDVASLHSSSPVALQPEPDSALGLAESADVCLCCLQWIVQPSQAEEADEQMRLKAHGVRVWHPY